MVSRLMLVRLKCKNNILNLAKKTNKPTAKESLKNKFSEQQSSPDDDKSVGSSNAFEATENPQKDNERELSDEELDDLIDDNK